MCSEFTAKGCGATHSSPMTGKGTSFRWMVSPFHETTRTDRLLDSGGFGTVIYTTAQRLSRIWVCKAILVGSITEADCSWLLVTVPFLRIPAIAAIHRRTTTNSSVFLQVNNKLSADSPTLAVCCTGFCPLSVWWCQFSCQQSDSPNAS